MTMNEALKQLNLSALECRYYALAQTMQKSLDPINAFTYPYIVRSSRDGSNQTVNKISQVQLFTKLSKLKDNIEIYLELPSLIYMNRWDYETEMYYTRTKDHYLFMHMRVKSNPGFRIRYSAPSEMHFLGNGTTQIKSSGVGETSYLSHTDWFFIIDPKANVLSLETSINLMEIMINEERLRQV